jgi:hypothetical protein
MQTADLSAHSTLPFGTGHANTTAEESGVFRGSNMTSFRVEVSGWDMDQQFFVEKTELDWYDGENKSIHLRTPVKRGAVLFVRLLEKGSSGQGFPVAYEANQILPENGPFGFAVELKRLRTKEHDAIKTDEPAGRRS